MVDPRLPKEEADTLQKRDEMRYITCRDEAEAALVARGDRDEEEEDDGHDHRRKAS